MIFKAFLRDQMYDVWQMLNYKSVNIMALQLCSILFIISKFLNLWKLSSYSYTLELLNPAEIAVCINKIVVR